MPSHDFQEFASLPTRAAFLPYQLPEAAVEDLTVGRIRVATYSSDAEGAREAPQSTPSGATATTAACFDRYKGAGGTGGCENNAHRMFLLRIAHLALVYHDVLQRRYYAQA